VVQQPTRLPIWVELGHPETTMPLVLVQVDASGRFSQTTPPKEHQTIPPPPPLELPLPPPLPLPLPPPDPLPELHWLAQFCEMQLPALSAADSQLDSCAFEAHCCVRLLL
jgi:hypothetical protein